MLDHVKDNYRLYIQFSRKKQIEPHGLSDKYQTILKKIKRKKEK